MPTGRSGCIHWSATAASIAPALSGQARRGRLVPPERAGLNLRDPAVGNEIDAGGVAAVAGCQEQRGRSHLLRSADPAERWDRGEEGARAVGLFLVLELAVDDRRVDRARRQRVPA